MNAPADRIHASDSALLTDFCQLTMLQAYDSEHMHGEASFELFCRRLPACRGFVMAAGLEPALEWLEGLRFSGAELAWLSASGRFKASFVKSLSEWRFTGEVAAVREGTVVFPGEPILRVTAPINQAQFVESRLVNLIHAHSLIASKAARCVLAAGHAELIDFGLRQAHGSDSAMITARAAHLAGFSATANVLAGMQAGLPLSGAMAQSYVLSHDAETLAFIEFGRANPDDVVLLIDTWDAEQGAYRAVAAAEALARDGIRLRAVRIESGDLAALSHRVRAIFDSAGMEHVRILVSGELDERRIAALRTQAAPIDAYCVGTALSTSPDAPSLDLCYKLVDYGERGCTRHSVDKATLPGRKQVWRRHDDQGQLAEDLIALADEAAPNGHAAAWQPLLEPVMRSGFRLRPAPSMTALREHAASQLAALGMNLRKLVGAAALPMRQSDLLKRLAIAQDAKLTRVTQVSRLAQNPQPAATGTGIQVDSGSVSSLAPASALASRSATARQASPGGGRSTRMRRTPAASRSRSPA